MLTRKNILFNLQLFAETQEGSADAELGGDKEQAKTFEESYVKKLRTENANYRMKNKELESSMDQKFTEFQNNIFKSLGIDPDPNKNYEKQISDLKSKAQEAEARANQKLIKAEVKSISSTLGIIDPDIAFKLIDVSSMKVRDDGTVEGVKEALEALLREKPFLKGQSGPVGSPTNPGSQNVKETVDDKMNSLIRRMSGYAV